MRTVSQGLGAVADPGTVGRRVTVGSDPQQGGPGGELAVQFLRNL